MIHYNKGILMAQLVLNQLQLIIERENIKKDYYVESYQNCREQGFAIMLEQNLFEKTIYITKQRNTDKLALYIGSYTFQGLSNDAYQDKHEFEDGEEYKAAKFILENL